MSAEKQFALYIGGAKVPVENVEYSVTREASKAAPVEARRSSFTVSLEAVVSREFAEALFGAVRETEKWCRWFAGVQAEARMRSEGYRNCGEWYYSGWVRSRAKSETKKPDGSVEVTLGERDLAVLLAVAAELACEGLQALSKWEAK